MPLTEVYVMHNAQLIKVEADEVNHGPIKANARFFCRVCGEDVSFISAGVYCAHFRHHPNGPDCPQRTIGEGGGSQSTIPSFPTEKPRGAFIRLNPRKGGVYGAQLGIPPVTSGMLKAFSQARTKIQIRACGDVKEFNLCDRLKGDGESVTYVDLGCYSELYNLTVINRPKHRADDNWPTGKSGLLENYTLSGFTTNGALYSAETGKRLLFQSEVFVGKEYLFLYKGKNRFPYNRSNIEISELHIDNRDGWRLYKVCAMAWTQSAVQVFIKMGGVRLSTKGEKMIPLWPPHVVNDDLIRFSKQEKNFWALKIEDFVYWVKDGRARYSNFDVECGLRQVKQFNSVFPVPLNDGILQVGEYALWKCELNDIAEKPFVQVLEDEDRTKPSVEYIVYDALPLGEKLAFKPDYDGRLEIDDASGGHKVYYLKANHEIRISVAFGMHISVFQGLDCLGTISFDVFRKEEELTIDDRAFLKRGGNLVRSPQMYRHLVMRISGKPELVTILQQKINAGTLSYNDLAVVRKCLTEQK